jgi:hypothetical protein
MATLFDQGDKVSKEVWIITGMKTQTMVESPSIFLHKKKTNKILDVRLEGVRWAGKKVG